MPGNAEDMIFRVSGNRKKQRVYILFDATKLLGSVGGSETVEITVVGRLDSGEYIFGADTVKINRKKSGDRVPVRRRSSRTVRSRR